MSISVQQIHNRLLTYLNVHLPDNVLKALIDTDYIQYYNDVARDMNSIADIRKERFYKKCNSTNAEDDNLLNYLAQGIVLKIYKLKYIDDAYETQYYTYINDRIVLKVTPESNTQMDIHYLRDIEEVEELTDDVDLPDSVIPDYEQLLKVKLLIDYGGRTDLDYEYLLEKYAKKSRTKINDDYKSGVDAYWFGQDGCDSLYDITENWIGIENFTADVNGNYIHVGGND